MFKHAEVQGEFKRAPKKRLTAKTRIRNLVKYNNFAWLSALLIAVLACLPSFLTLPFFDSWIFSSDYLKR